MISIRNANKGFALNIRVLKSVVVEILKQTIHPKRFDIEIEFVTDSKIRALNKKYLKKDAPTDVISFDLGNVGDIYISLDAVRRNCGNFGNSFERELTLYVVHGILHLSGYDDIKAADAARMSRKQNRILSKLCRNLDLSKVLMQR